VVTALSGSNGEKLLTLSVFISFDKTIAAVTQQIIGIHLQK
jgi:hypothetical protein